MIAESGFVAPGYRLPADHLAQNSEYDILLSPRASLIAHV